MKHFLFVVVLSLFSCASVSVKDLVAQRNAAVAQPEDIEEWIKLGDLYAEAKMVDEALAAWSIARRLDPENEAVSDRMGDISADPSYREAYSRVMSEPGNDEFWGALGMQYMSDGETEKGLRYLRFAYRLDPTDMQWQQAISRAGQEAPLAGQSTEERQAVAALEAGDNVSALQHFFRALVDGTENRALRGAFLDLVEGEPELLGIAKDAASKSGAHDEILGFYGISLVRQGRTEPACDAFENALKADPSDQEWNRAGTLCSSNPGALAVDLVGVPIPERLATLARRGEVDTLEEFLKSLIRQNKNRYHWDDFLVYQTGKKKHVLMAELLSGAEKGSSDNGQSYGELGDAYLEDGNYERALALYEEAFKYDPDEDHWQWKIRMVRGVLAIPPETYGTPENPYDESARLLETGDTAGAVEILRKIVGTEGDQIGISPVLMALTKQTRVELMESIVGEFAALDEAHGEYADALVGAGRADEARQQYERATEIDATDNEWSVKIAILKALAK